MDRKEKNEIIKVKVVQILLAIAIVLMAGIVFSGNKVSATSQENCIVLEPYSSEGASQSYNVGSCEVVVEDGDLCINQKGAVLERVQQSSWDTGWIIEDTLYYSKDEEIYSYVFSKKKFQTIMSFEAAKTPNYQEYEPKIIKVLAYYQTYLYVEINNGSLYEDSVIRINLKSKTQQTIIENPSSTLYVEFLGIYNNYMYFAYPTMDPAWYHGFSRISLGDNPREEVIEDSTSEVFLYGDKIYYLDKQGNSGNIDCTLKSYDLASGAKVALYNWKKQNLGIKKIENGSISLYDLQTNQEFQYNISTGSLVNTNYVEPLRDIKVSHHLVYKDKKATIKDVCKITWDKSFEGNIEIDYNTYSNSDSYLSDWKKQIKATQGKNYCLLNLTGGRTYYIKIRTYKESGGNKVCSQESNFKFSARKITSLDESKERGCNYIKVGKYVYYSCKENGKFYIYKSNTKTGKQKIIMRSKSKISLLNATNRYFYYQQGKRLFSYDVKKHTHKKMKDNIMFRTYLLPINGKVVCYEMVDAEGWNPDFYLFHADGSHGKKLGKGFHPFIYKKQIYWQQSKGRGDEPIYYRYCKCNASGKKTKAVTKWIPQNEYYKIARKVNYSIKKTYFKIRKNRKWLK